MGVKNKEQLERAYKNRILPLLNEYFYNNENEVVNILAKGGINVEMNMDTFQLEYRGLV